MLLSISPVITMSERLAWYFFLFVPILL
jgi:hypothetical protein